LIFNALIRSVKRCDIYCISVWTRIRQRQLRTRLAMQRKWQAPPAVSAASTSFERQTWLLSSQQHAPVPVCHGPPKHAGKRGEHDQIRPTYSHHVRSTFIHTVKPVLAVTSMKQPTCLKQPNKMFPNVKFVLIFTSVKQPPALSSHFLTVCLKGTPKWSSLVT